MISSGDGARTKDCAVVYLERFGNPPFFAHTFLRSMERFDAGAPFDYIHVLKGFPSGATSQPLAAHMKRTGRKAGIFHVPDTMLPTGALLPMLRDLKHEKVLLLMSWSRLLAPNWLRCYLDAFKSAPDIGIAGATGGYERSDHRDLSLPFPNTGIRTTAFMMDRDLFCALAEGISTREDELQFESGDESLTKLVMRRGLKPVVVDRAGRVWHADEWPVSRTFRSGHQEGLLIADNRTHDYDRSRDKRRQKLAQINWGEHVVPPRNPAWRRLWVDLKWRYLGR